MPSEDGGAIVKLCLACARRRAALALPGARAREGGARPRGARARVPASRVLAGARVPERPAPAPSCTPGGGPEAPSALRGSCAFRSCAS